MVEAVADRDLTTDLDLTRNDGGDPKDDYLRPRLVAIYRDTFKPGYVKTAGMVDDLEWLRDRLGES